MIDLDQPAQHQTPPNGTTGRWRRFARARVLILVAVVVFLAGAVLGGAAMDFWRYRPLAASVEAEASVVSVLLFTEPGTSTVLSRQGRVRIEAQVTVVNAGPETVSVLAVRVDQPGVTVRSPEKGRRVAAGTAFPVDVVVEWTCRAEEPDALLASVSVETDDERVRQISSVAVRGTPWTENRRKGCAGMG